MLITLFHAGMHIGIILYMYDMNKNLYYGCPMYTRYCDLITIVTNILFYINISIYFDWMAYCESKVSLFVTSV